MKVSVRWLMLMLLALASQSLMAYETCNNYLKKNDTTGYDACESRNKKEIREKRQEEDQEEALKWKTMNDQTEKYRREDEARRTEEYRKQMLDLQKQQLQLQQQQQQNSTVFGNNKPNPDLSFMAAKISVANDFISDNLCADAKRQLDIFNKMVLEGKGFGQEYSKYNDMTITWTDIKEASVVVKARYIYQCEKDNTHLMSYIKMEIKNGSEAARTLLTAIEKESRQPTTRSLKNSSKK